MNNTYIVSNWSELEQKTVVDRQATKQKRYEYYKEFKESYCDLFDFRDFMFYAEETGLKLLTLLHLAKYADR